MAVMDMVNVFLYIFSHGMITHIETSEAAIISKCLKKSSEAILQNKNIRNIKNSELE